MKYNIEWSERIPCWAQVEAESKEEALQKAEAGQFIPGSVDSDLGDRVGKFTVRETK